jgi:hypothetical protein
MACSKRRSLVVLGGLTPVLWALPQVQARAQAVVTEMDQLAHTLDYVTDTRRANQTDYPSHTPAMMCRLCTSYMGDPAAASGPCRTFSGRIVSANGWCSAFDPRTPS